MKKKIVIISIILLICTSMVLFFSFNKKEKNIDKILKTKSYSYLTKEAKNYIEKVYEETGQVILTEKNKQPNEPYLSTKYIDYLSLSDEEKKNVDEIPDVYTIDYIQNVGSTTDGATLPSKFTLQNVSGKNYTTPTKDQGDLDLCWVFTTIENAESYLMQKNGESYSSSTLKFSARQADYGISNNGIKDYTNENGIRTLTSAGNFTIASMFFSNGLGLIDNNKMIYTETTEPKELQDVLNYGNSKYEVNSTIQYPVQDFKSSNSGFTESINDVKQLVMNNGGAYIGTQAPSASCSALNSDNNYIIQVDDTCLRNAGHGMQIIGWDDNYTYSYCKSGTSHQSATGCSSSNLVTGKGAWILRNSWGSYFPIVYLAYETQASSIGTITSMSTMDSRNWDNNYPSVSSVTYISYNNSITKNVTKKVNTKEKVQKVKFYTLSQYGYYNVSITSSKETYNNIKQVFVEYPGIATIDLSDLNIEVTDSNFNVKIESTNGGVIVDKTISVFTSNVDKTPVIKSNTSKITTEQLTSDYSFRLYSNTKNIPSNQTITYKLYNSSNTDVSTYLTVNYNKVAKNDVNALLKISKNIPVGSYTLKLTYSNATESIPVIIGTEKVTITYNSNYGTPITTTQTAIKNESVTLQDNTFIRTGYTFSKWNTKQDGSGTNYNNKQTISSITSNLTLYAQWTSIKYNLAFNANTGTGTMNTQQVTYDVQTNINSNTFTKTGYTFVSWNTNANGTGTSYTDAQSIKNLTTTNNSTITLYAQWTPINYNVAFNNNTGSGTMVNQQMTYNKEYNLRSNSFTKTGYTFNKWNTKQNGSGTNYTNTQVVKNLTATNNSTITLYAQWTPNTYNVVFNKNNGSGTMTNQQMTYDVNTPLNLNAFTRTGYTFSKWNTKQDGTGTNYTNTQVVKNLTATNNSTITLYAQWTPITYSIVFNSNTGTGTMNTQQVTYDVNTELSANQYTKTGASFVKWNTKQDGTGTDYTDKQSIKNLVSTNNGTITLYAQWKVINISITANPTSVDFGNTYVNYQDNIQRGIVVKNTGNDNITLHITNPTTGPFDVSFDSNHVIKPNEEYNITLIAKAGGTNSDTPGTYNGTYNIKATSVTDNIQTKTINVTSKIVLNIRPMHVAYSTHVESIGWQDYVRDGAMSGTSGRSLRLEAIKIAIENQNNNGNIEYRTQVQDYGWMSWVSNGSMSGTSHESKRLEAIEIRLTGEMAEEYDVYYRVHAQDVGWMSWASNGSPAGTEGYGRRLEGIEIVLVDKGENPPVRTNIRTNKSYVKKQVAYRTHVQDYGWQKESSDGQMSGTSGESKRLEGIEISLYKPSSGSGIQYRTHVQNYGWMNWVSNGTMSGTSGESKRLEAIEIRLTGEVATTHDVYYRVHAENFGWMGWAKNGESAGTAHYAYRLEGIEIVVVEKGDNPPERTDIRTPQAFIDKNA